MKLDNIAILVENLGKRYHIGQTMGYQSLRENIMSIITSPKFRRLAPAIEKPSNSNYIWALKNVSFEVKQGDVVGVIGRNGAGKTTLLKILTRITEPTEGSASIRGRVGALLEVGTGFHPELTGRENIYLNGAVLGMKKKEIDYKFDEIVEFAGVELFIDTPLKRYSTGMQMRLAFSVAGHLEPEILLVDEVLAVGDSEFQKRCLGRMGDIAKGGRTILFVSHNMSAVVLLCNRAILLRDGRLVKEGPASQVISYYLSSEDSISNERTWEAEDAPGSDLVKLVAVRVVNELEEMSSDLDITESVNLEMDFRCLQRTRVTPAFRVQNQLGVLVFLTTNLHDSMLARKEYEIGLHRLSCRIPGNFLNDGDYSVSVYLSTGLRQANDVSAEQVVSFHMHDLGTGQQDYISGQWVGTVRPLLSWEAKELGNGF